MKPKFTLPAKKSIENSGNLCKINVSCSQPSESGDMSVECSFEGDAVLATFLLEKALRYVESHIDDENWNEAAL